MVRIVFFVFFFFPLFITAQKHIDLKKRYFGSYEGEIPSYMLDSGKDLIDIDPSPIKVLITEKTVELEIGREKLEGTYSVMFEGDKYFLLDCKIKNQLAGERIVVYKRGKKISRDGLFPQPNTFLYLKKR